MSEDSHTSDNEDQQDDPYDDLEKNLPSGYSMMRIDADEMDYLKAYWELRDNGQLFGWAVRFLYDLSKLDEAGWIIALQKASYDDDTHEVVHDVNYKAAAFRLKSMMPAGKREFVRLPTAEKLEVLMRRTPLHDERDDEELPDRI